MKKILALVMAVAMLLSCAAFAEEAKDPMEVDRSLEARLNLAWVNPEILTQEWTLTAAYISEDFIEEFELEDVTAGLIPMAPGTATMVINAEKNHCASDKALGQITDQANYWHDHVYCMNGTIVFSAYEDEKYTLKSEWNEWTYEARGEMDGDYNYGPAKTKVKGDDDFLYWNELVGVDCQEEEMKYIFMNTSGQLVLCATDGNIVTNPKKAIFFAYIFDKVVPAEAAE